MVGTGPTAPDARAVGDRAFRTRFPRGDGRYTLISMLPTYLYATFDTSTLLSFGAIRVCRLHSMVPCNPLSCTARACSFVIKCPSAVARLLPGSCQAHARALVPEISCQSSRPTTVQKEKYQPKASNGNSWAKNSSSEIRRS